MARVGSPINAIYNAHSLRAIVRGDCVDQKGDHFLGDLVLDVYTGWIGIRQLMGWTEMGGVWRTELVTYVPLGPIDHPAGDPGPLLVDIQAYNNVFEGRPLTQAVVHATLTSLVDNPDVAAVDVANILVEPRLFPGTVGEQFVPILYVTGALQAGEIHGFSYHITVLSQPKEQGPGILPEMDAARIPVDRLSKPL